MNDNSQNNCSGAYAHMLLIFKELSSRIKARIKESKTTRNLNRQLITMTDISTILSDFENMLNNSLSLFDTQVTISIKQADNQTQNRNNNQTNENKTMNKKQTIRLNESQLRRIVKEAVNKVLRESEFNDIGFNISVDEDVFTPQEINKITSIAKKYDVEYDGMGSYYVYDIQDFQCFVREIKRLGFGKTVYLYKGEGPDFEWYPIGKETI